MMQHHARPPRGPPSTGPKFVVSGFQTTPSAPVGSSQAAKEEQQCGAGSSGSVGRRSPTSRSLLSELLLVAAMEDPSRRLRPQQHHEEDDFDDDDQVEDDELSEQESPTTMEEDEMAETCRQQRTSGAVSIPSTRRTNADAIARALHAQQVQALLQAQAKYTEALTRARALSHGGGHHHHHNHAQGPAAGL